MDEIIENYLIYCKEQKQLDPKTLKAYRIDLTQFSSKTKISYREIDDKTLEKIISEMHITYKPKTVKRKIASIKSFFHYLQYKNMIDHNPFFHLQIHFREPINLPKTIPLNIMELLLQASYNEQTEANTPYKRKNAIRNCAIIELLFATGMRVSELCGLKPLDINLLDGTILIYGKGRKERKLQIGNNDVLSAISKYKEAFSKEISECGYLFVNQSGRPFTDQSVRRMLNYYTKMLEINLHITPHMLRHTFATSLLDADVDIRYIQEMLGHSSISTTEIYTHVAVAKQREILKLKHPRKDFRI